MRFENTKSLYVTLKHYDKNYEVGRLALKDLDIYFEYNPDFIKTKIEISPLKLPLKIGINKGDRKIFDGLFGVFNDSLPDSWGQLLLSRQLRKQKIAPNTLNPLDKLRILDDNSLGALRYYSKDKNFLELDIDGSKQEINLAKLNDHSSKILDDKEVKKSSLESLVKLGFSSGGARPKAMLKVSKDKNKILFSKKTLQDYEDWIIKFPSKFDNKEIALIEYAYNLMATESGITVSDCHLFEKEKKLFFGTKRFDRKNNQAIHVHSASGLLHSDYRYPSLDYDTLLRLTLALTKDINEVSKMFRLCVFNVLSHNRDDHAKNFSFYINEFNEWKLSPAYDLTFSEGPGGEHSSTVNGEGKNPKKSHLIDLAKKHNIKKAEDIFNEVYLGVSKWSELAENLQITAKTHKIIKAKITQKD